MATKGENKWQPSAIMEAIAQPLSLFWLHAKSGQKYVNNWVSIAHLHFVSTVDERNTRESMMLLTVVGYNNWKSFKTRARAMLATDETVQTQFTQHMRIIYTYETFLMHINYTHSDCYSCTVTKAHRGTQGHLITSKLL